MISLNLDFVFLFTLSKFSLYQDRNHRKIKKIANPLVLLSLQLSLDRKSKKNQKISLFLSPELEEWPKISFALDFSSFSLNRDPEWSKITLSLLSSFLYQQRFRNPTPKKNGSPYNKGGFSDFIPSRRLQKTGVSGHSRAKQALDETNFPTSPKFKIQAPKHKENKDQNNNSNGNNNNIKEQINKQN